MPQRLGGGFVVSCKLGHEGDAGLEVCSWTQGPPRLCQRSVHQADDRPQGPRRPGGGSPGSRPFAGWSWKWGRPGRCRGRQLEIHERIRRRPGQHRRQYPRRGRCPVPADAV